MSHEALLAEPTTAKPTAAPQRKSLRSNASWTLFGNIVYTACQSGWLVLISKLSSSESRGRFVLALAIASPIIAFANFGLRGMLATDVRGEHRFLRYVAFRSISAACALIVIMGIALTQHPSAAWVLVAVGLGKSIELISDIIWGRMQQFEQFDWIAWSLMIKGATSLVLLSVGLLLTHDAVGASAGIATGFFLTLLLWDIPSALKVSGQAPHSIIFDARDLSAKWQDSAGPMWEFVRQAAPLAFASSVVLLNGNLVIYFIRWSFAAEKAEPMVGLFGAFNYLPQVGMIVMAAIAVACSTRLATFYNDDNLREFYRLVRRLLLLGAVLGAVGIATAIVAGKPIVALLFKQEDAEHSSVLIWLMLSGAISYLASVLGYTVTATRQFHRLTVPYIFVTIVGVLASALLIPKFELTGAAWTSCIINLTICAALAFILCRLHFDTHHEPASRTTG
jgi:O-antigen/teichoic acid export membrane protein